jgi:hypothetical protein
MVSDKVAQTKANVHVGRDGSKAGNNNDTNVLRCRTAAFVTALAERILAFFRETSGPTDTNDNPGGTIS